jgi:hypothetical protein
VSKSKKSAKPDLPPTPTEIAPAAVAEIFSAYDAVNVAGIEAVREEHAAGVGTGNMASCLANGIKPD